MLKFGQRFKAEDNNWRENDKYANYCYHSGCLRTVGMLKQQPNFALQFILRKWTFLFLYKTFILSVEKESLWKILHQKNYWLLRATRSVHFNRHRKHSIHVSECDCRDSRGREITTATISSKSNQRKHFVEWIHRVKCTEWLVTCEMESFSLQFLFATANSTTDL